MSTTTKLNELHDKLIESLIAGLEEGNGKAWDSAIKLLSHHGFTVDMNPSLSELSDKTELPFKKKTA